VRAYRRYDVSLGEGLQTLRRVVRWGLTDVCRVKSPNVVVAWLLFLECLILQMKELRSFEKSCKYSPNGTASYPRRLES